MKLASFVRGLLKEYHDGDVWYEKSRGGYSREKGHGAPWVGQHNGEVMYFLTRSSAERYAKSGHGKLADEKHPVQESPVLAQSEGKKLLDALTRFVYENRQDIKRSQLGVEATNVLQGMKNLVSGFEQLQTTESLKLRRAFKEAATSWEDLRHPWHKQLDGYVADASEFKNQRPFHPITNKTLYISNLKRHTDAEGEVTMWQGVVDGVKLTIFND